MPIDIDLLRADRGILERLLESQCQRFPDVPRDALCQALESTKTRDAARRRHVKDLENERNKLKTLQKSLAPNSPLEIDRNEAKQQVKLLKKSIQNQQVALQTEEQDIHDMLIKVGNAVDIIGDYLELEAHRVNIFSELDIVDPVFSIGGYEKIHFEGPSSFTALSAHGAELARAITTHAISSFKEERFPLVALPQSIPLEKTRAHSALGCQPDRCEDQSPLYPSFLAASLLHKDKTYWDRALPRGHVCVSSSQHLFDERERQRRATFRHTKQKWWEEVPAEQVGLLGMTICTLDESRRFQIEMADRIVDFHASLLIPERFCKSRRGTVMVRKRVVPASQLLPCEASRILIEGYLLGGYVCLGFVSNCTDFVTRAMKTRCGGSYVEYVHSVHATCCSVTETLEWLAHNNLAKDEEETGVSLPPSLTLTMGYDHGATVFFPFERQVSAGKAGRKPVVKVLPATNPRTIGDSLLNTTANNDDIAHVPPKAKTPFALDRMPTPEEVRAEVYMSPFDFLPLKK